VGDDVKQKNQGRYAEILRRHAINLYFLAKEQREPIKRVSPERLDQFIASFPPWVQSAFEPYPPDEARRRLTIVYRLVFPYPNEIKPAARVPAAPGGAPPGSQATKKGGARGSAPERPGQRSPF
jgi:hypothetical protein